MQIKVKPLRWGGKRADTLIGSYVLEVNDNKKWIIKSYSFRWYPDVEYASEKTAKAVCQRHFNKLIMEFLDIEEHA